MIIRFCSALFIAALVFGVPTARAQDAATNNATAPGTTAPAPKVAKKAKKKAAKLAGIPFHGKLEAVDKSAMTITLTGKEKPRVILVTSRTRITKAGKPATLSDISIGETVTGQLIKTANGREEAVRLKSGTADTNGKVKAKTPPAN